MTILRSILERGYFPKELPPSFFTEGFAAYASTKKGRAVLEAYKSVDNLTECVAFDLALPGLARRPLRIPHPAAFCSLTRLTSKNFRRLLTKAGRSRFSKSRPVYVAGRFRAISANVKPANLARERSAARAGGSYLVKLDVNHFYPALYTHAIGWAIDPKTRSKKHWKNMKLLGKQMDQALMNLQGKVSQGIPIGTDISFLLGEVVLAQVDRQIPVPPSRCYRWFDDFEITCDTREEAEAVLASVTKALRSFNLRTNAKKTAICALPQPAHEHWQQAIATHMNRPLHTPNDVVLFFDHAFRIRDEFPESPVLMYALGTLFKIRNPTVEMGRVAQSGIAQALLGEPGTAQKAFALLTFWHLNGFAFDRDLFGQTINRMIHRHAGMGVSSDVAWALSFAIDHKILLDARAAKVLASCDDDCVVIQALDAHSRGLMPKGFSLKRIDAFLSSATLDGEHWLSAYESVRQGFRNVCEASVKANPLFADLLARKIAFYRTKLPAYASVVQTGGAPEWVVTRWIDILTGRVKATETETKLNEKTPFLTLLQQDLPQVAKAEATTQETVIALLDVEQKSRTEVENELVEYEPYA